MIIRKSRRKKRGGIGRLGEKRREDE